MLGKDGSLAFHSLFKRFLLFSDFNTFVNLHVKVRLVVLHWIWALYIHGFLRLSRLELFRPGMKWVGFILP